MLNANKSEVDQSFSLSTSKPNNTSYTAVLEAYYMLCNKYYLLKELLDAMTAILRKNRPDRHDFGIVLKI